MKIIAAVLIVMALVIGIVPQFTDCASQGRALTLENGKTVPMKCHWTGQAEIAIAVPLLVLGGLVFFNRRRETLRALFILGIVLGVLAILLPTVLIGVCVSPDMLCNSAMKPTLIFTGIVTVIASLIGLFLSAKNEPEATDSPSA
ncbi:MAG: hypothetical protein A2136_00305 [Chloroflexi bacterium RBG_16_54_11]|nr:MAG: hypothetical protein A2136_00305 [Chloroflexi bacterium RBG_16_54_11]